MTQWMRGLAPEERRAFIAAFGGWMMDAMDYMAFTFVIPSLLKLWQISSGEAGLLATVTLLVSALGGWLAGALADRFGRVHVLQLTILWFAVFTCLNGFATGFGMLFTTRALQGLGFGGEWAVGSVLIGEIIRAEHRGKWLGVLQGGWAVGWGIAAILYALFYSVLPETWAWRALFWVGIAPALLVFYVRRYVPEPKIFDETRRRAAEGGGNFMEIFSPNLIYTTICAALLATGAQGGYYAITTWLPTFLRTVRKLTVLNSSGYLAVIIIGSFVGYLVSGWLNDRIGRRASFALFAVCSAATVIVYMLLPVDDTAIMVLGFPLGFFASGIFSGMGPFMTELFPSRCRGSGQGFCYNFGRGIGALFPGLVGYLSASLGLGLAIGIFALIAYGLVLVATAMLPETRGKQLLVYD
ncbi:MAG TPA: MFS transporter [Stellaceae bacterium]|nr:MFS transporter [Stellaceae bacterium]